MIAQEKEKEKDKDKDKDKKDHECHWKMIVRDMERNFQDIVKKYGSLLFLAVQYLGEGIFIIIQERVLGSGLGLVLPTQHLGM